MSNILLAGETGRGLVRPRNEDSFCLASCPETSASLAVIADGIGGQFGGDIASYVCCKKFLDAWRKRNRRFFSEEDAAAFLRETANSVNRLLFERNRFEKNKTVMGTTVACVLFWEDKMMTGHAGDSRVYMFLAGRGMTRLTCDHTLQEMMSRKGKVVSAKGIAMPPEDTIVQAVGIRGQLDLELQTFDRPSSARYLVCSDGLSRYVPEERIAGCMEQANTPREAVNLLFREAFLAGAPDNVSVICGFPEEKTSNQRSDP